MSDTPEWDEWMLEQGAASPSGPREALSGEAASPAAGLDPEAVRHYLWSERHESEHPGDGYYESCMECMRAADATIAGLSRSGDRDELSSEKQ